MRDAEQILSSMTLKEKIALCEGANFWETKAFPAHGIPSLFLCDGPHGLRRQDLSGKMDMLGLNRSRPSTCFPSAVTTACGWDPALTERIGAAIGEEARDQGAGVVLGPGCNLKRDPLCGRNFEYFSEDPFLAGKLAAGFIRGAEAQGVGTSLKHFAANSQELCRFQSDSVMDARTLRELYLTGFEIAVKEGRPSTVMCAYNKLGGVHCSDSKSLLTGILREEWGFDGVVVTDWGAMYDRREAFRAGCDLNMPGGSAYMEKDVLAAVKDGSLSEADIDRSARRILTLVLRSAAQAKPAAACSYEAHHALAKEAALQGAVLLKNEYSLLPIREGAKIALIGAMAADIRYQGSGSSHICPTRLSQPAAFFPGAVTVPGCDGEGVTSPALLAEVADAAKAADVAVVFAGLPARCESEGFDRSSMAMPEGHTAMIRAAAAANPRTVVVLLCGSPVECPWAEEVQAVLYMGLPGQAGGEAAAELLYGRANPCGKLAESWPFAYSDAPTSGIYGKTKDALYMEGLYTGYRYYDTAGVPVRWPFGHGLSYTKFESADLTVTPEHASLTVTNTGSRAGHHVVQLFVRPPRNGIHRPMRELKGFAKCFLQPGESRRITLPLTDRSFALWQDGWKIPAGVYTLEADGLTAELSLAGESLPAPAPQKGTWYEAPGGTPPQADWEALYSLHPDPKVFRKGSFTMDASVLEMAEHSRLMGLFAAVLRRALCRGQDPDSPECRMLIASSVGSPLRNLQICGGIKGGIMPGLLEMANGRFLRGLWKMLRG